MIHYAILVNKTFFSKKCHPSRGILKVENFPLQKKKIFLQNCKNWNILQRCKNFFFFEKCHPSSGILKVENFPLQKKKIFFFAELQELEHSAEGTFFRKIGNFSTFSTNSKIPKIYLSGPISVQSFSKKYFLKKSGIQAVGF